MATMKSITASGSRLGQLKRLALVLAKNIDSCEDAGFCPSWPSSTGTPSGRSRKWREHPAMTTKSARSSRSGSRMGSQEPSARIAPAYRSTDGGDAVRILRAGGTIPDPWQSDVLEDWMGRTPSGKWAAPTAGGSVPRQNGKSLLVQGRAEAGMLLFNETVIYTAHLQKTATETFEEMRAFFEGARMRRYVEEIRTALGREQIILKSGARIKFLARTRNGGRGQHGDLLIFDEAQELDETAQGSFLPAISASLEPADHLCGHATGGRMPWAPCSGHCAAARWMGDAKKGPHGSSSRWTRSGT